MNLPRFTEYGRLVDIKNGLKTRTLVGALVKAMPESEFRENPVITHEVIVSGIFAVRVSSFKSKLGVKGSSHIEWLLYATGGSRTR